MLKLIIHRSYQSLPSIVYVRHASSARHAALDLGGGIVAYCDGRLLRSNNTYECAYSLHDGPFVKRGRVNLSSTSTTTSTASSKHVMLDDSDRATESGAVKNPKNSQTGSSAADVEIAEDGERLACSMHDDKQQALTNSNGVLDDLSRYIKRPVNEFKAARKKRQVDALIRSLPPKEYRSFFGGPPQYGIEPRTPEGQMARDALVLRRILRAHENIQAAIHHGIGFGITRSSWDPAYILNLTPEEQEEIAWLTDDVIESIGSSFWYSDCEIIRDIKLFCMEQCDW